MGRLGVSIKLLTDAKYCRIREAYSDRSDPTCTFKDTDSAASVIATSCVGSGQRVKQSRQTMLKIRVHSMLDPIFFFFFGGPAAYSILILLLVGRFSECRANIVSESFEMN